MTHHAQLDIWLQKHGHRKFNAPTMGRVWCRVYEAYSGNGGRYGIDFQMSCVELGFDVKRVGKGFVFGRVKK